MAQTASQADPGARATIDRAAPSRVLALLEAERARWFLWVPVLLGAGIAAYFLLPFEPSLAACLVPLALVLVLRAIGSRGLAVVLVVDIAVLAAGGLALAKLRADMVAAPVLARAIGPVEVRGHVELVEPRETGGERITLRVAAIAGLAPEATPRRVRIRAASRRSGLQPGDPIRLVAHLAPPAPPAIPGGYDFARSAWFLGLGGVGYAVSRPGPDAELGAAPPTLAAAAAIQRVRQAIGARVVASLGGQTGAIANGLITGERGGISEATNDAYRDSGLFHILSISGLHMAVMGGAVFYAVRLLLALSPTLALTYPIRKWAAVAAFLGSAGYLAISGMSFATVRAFIMISIMFLAILLDRPALALRNVALAALVILVLFPESLLDVGFQMSFAAVVALVAAYEAVRERSAERARRGFGPVARTSMFFAGIVLSTVVASLAVAPFSLYHFHKSQLLAVLANLLAIPVCNVIVMPGALATLVLMPLGLEGPALAVMGLGVDLMTRVAEWVAAMPGAVARHRAIATHAFALTVVGGLWLALWEGRWRLAGLAAIAAGIALAPVREVPDLLVGRGGSLVAARTDGIRLGAVGTEQARYELARWLEQDGDERGVEEVTSTGFRCDRLGCTARIDGLGLAVARHPAALADDCRSADILVLDIPRPAGCTGPRRVIDFYDVRIDGAHAVYVDEGDIRVETVAAERGVRPWSPPHEWARLRSSRGQHSERPAEPRPGTPAVGPGARPPRAVADGEAARDAIRGARSRLATFAAPSGLVAPRPAPRPEDEDDEPPPLEEIVESLEREAPATPGSAGPRQ